MRSLISLYRNVQAFGIQDGSRAVAARIAATMFPALRDKLKILRLGGLPYPIHVRPGTSDWAVIHQVFIAREYDCPSAGHNQAVSEFYEDALSRSETPVIIDCGANIGLASIWYAQQYPRARIIAVEPEPENFRILALNVAKYPNIHVVQGGVFDRETRVTLSNTGDQPWTWETKETDAGEVTTHTIPGLMASLSNSKLMIVKIDIEGSEVALFRSNIEWVSNTPVIVFEAHDWHYNWRGTFHAIVSVLITHPRDYIQSGENMFSFSHELLSPT